MASSRNHLMAVEKATVRCFRIGLQLYDTTNNQSGLARVVLTRKSGGPLNRLRGLTA